MQFYHTSAGLAAAGRIILPGHVRQVARVYTKEHGWVRRLEAQLHGTVFNFDVPESEYDKPGEWVPRELGSGANFDPKDAHILLAAIAVASEPSFVLQPKGEYWSEEGSEEGLYHQGARLTNFQIESVRKRTIRAEVGVMAKGGELSASLRRNTDCPIPG